MRSAFRRLALIVGVVALGSGAAVWSPVASGADDPDPAKTERERDDVRSQRAEVDLQIDALQAKDIEVRAALSELENTVATQQAELDEAERAHEQAEGELAAAIQAVADAQLRIDELNRRADELVVQSFVSPPTDNALDAFRADSLSDAAVTVSTSGNHAGTSGGGAPQSQPLFPAATVYTTPAAVELQIAWCSGSPAQSL